MIHALVLVVFLPLLYRKRSPWLCTGLYAGVITVWGGIAMLAGHAGVLTCLTDIVVTSAVALACYWSLNHLKVGTATWATVVVVGMMVMMLFIGRPTRRIGELPADSENGRTSEKGR